MSNVNHLQGMLHDPYGLQHPYEQEPTERFPRCPIVGEPTSLGVATWPAGAAEAVWATWRREGLPGENLTEGHCVQGQNDENQDLWQVELPPLVRRRKILYRLHARRGDRHLSTEEFSFVVAEWSRAGSAHPVQVGPDHLIIEFTKGIPSSCSLLIISFSSVNALRLRLTGAGRDWLPKRESRVPFQVLENTDQCVVLRTEEVECCLSLRPVRLEVRRRDGSLLLRQADAIEWLVGESDRPLRVRQAFASPQEEGFYGFGERYNALNQRGNILDLLVFDQYRDQDRRTYLPVSFFLSSQGYGSYLATNRNVNYDLAASDVGTWSFSAELGPDATLDHHLIFEHKPAGIISEFANLVGKPTLPPTWAFGPWMSGNEWNSQATVMAQARKTLQHRIPAKVLVIEAWSDEATFYVWNDAQYEPKPAGDTFAYEDFTFLEDSRWPDPKGMIDELHRMGIRVLLWQIPVMPKLAEPHTQHDADESYMIEKGYCVRDADGQPYRIRPPWFRGGLVLDVTNPEARRWWLSKRAYLLDGLGADGFKTDGGEHLWGKDLRFADGRHGDELQNLYPILYVGAYHDFVQERRRGDGITFSRAGFTGAQAYPCHWAGDEISTWAAFRGSILAGLSAGISAIPFWGWDLGGFGGEIPSAELYLRAAAMAVFCPIMQYHSDYNEHRKPCRDRTPWNIAERTGEPEVIEVYRRLAQLRMQLLPYIQTEAAHCAATGEPLMRALFLDWPEDPVSWSVADQYCFGRALLVAPVVEPGTTQRRLYLPAGSWEDLWNGAELDGGHWITRLTPLDIIPVYRRVGALWPGLAPQCD